MLVKGESPTAMLTGDYFTSDLVASPIMYDDDGSLFAFWFPLRQQDPVSLLANHRTGALGVKIWWWPLKDWLRARRQAKRRYSGKFTNNGKFRYLTKKNEGDQTVRAVLRDL